MYNPSNFIVTSNQNSLINLVTNDSINLVFKIENKDIDHKLFNLSFELTLGDGIEFISSDLEYTSNFGNTFSFINTKDLAPNEIPYSFSAKVRLNNTNSNGDLLEFNSLISCSFRAFADTMPRGNFDSNNEVIDSITNFSVEVSKYTIVKELPSIILLGNTYTSKIIIKTSFNEGITFDNFYDFLGDGIQYLGNIVITGYSSDSLSNVIVTNPSTNINSYILTWNNVEIPANKTVEISFSFKSNEKFYKNGLIDGLYIENNSSISSELHWTVNNESFLLEYLIAIFEVLIRIESSNYLVDVGYLVTYKIIFYCNLYHGLLNLTGYLTTSDGQTLADESFPIMFTSKDISAGGVTQVTWNVGNISAGSNAEITIDSIINKQYIESGLNVLAGDTFNALTKCQAVSIPTNKIITNSDSTLLNSKIPNVTKSIINYYYRDNTEKSNKVLAPGDFIKYQSVYDSSNIQASIGRINFYDFYPYITKDISNIAYDSSSSNYLNTSGTPIDPYGVFWFYPELNDEKLITLNYTAQIDFENYNNIFSSNLFKIQLLNSNGIAFSNRSQANFKIGKPNIIITKNASGNNINLVRIDEIYTVNVLIENKDSITGTTDAFSINLTETIDSNLIVIPDSINALLNGYPLSTNLSNNTITLEIDKLGVSEQLTLTYNVKIPQTLGPNQKFNLRTETTKPYSQLYNSKLENLQYDVGDLNKNIKLKSQDVGLTLSSDSANKIIGDIVYYTFDVTVPLGQKLLDFYTLILLPDNHEYLNEATLNGNPIEAFSKNKTVVFPTLTNIDATNTPQFFSYKIKCKINNSLVSISNPIYTLETYYGNINYTTLTNKNINTGVNANLKINHPYIELELGSSNMKNGFKEPYSTNYDDIIYTKIAIKNFGNVLAKNIEVIVNIPTQLTFKNINLSESDMSYTLDSQSGDLTLIIDNIDRLSEKFIIIESQINHTTQAETVLIITSKIAYYYNSASETKTYTSPNIYNNEIFINSLLNFSPLSFYSLTDSNSAINLSSPGEQTHIEYILTNTGQGVDSYSLIITPVEYSYDLYIGTDFITNVSPNSTLSITPSQLANISNNSSRYIKLVYTIPNNVEAYYYDTLMITASSTLNIGNSKTIPTTLQDP